MARSVPIISTWGAFCSSLPRTTTKALSGRRPILSLDRNSSLCWILYLTDAPGKLSHCCLRLSWLVIDVVCQACVNHQAADAISWLRTAGHDTAYLNDMLLSVTIVPVCKAKKWSSSSINSTYQMKQSTGQNQDFPLYSRLKMHKLRLPNSWQPSFLPTVQEHTLSLVGVNSWNTCSDYSYICNEFMIHAVPIDDFVHKVFLWSIQTRLIRVYHFLGLPERSKERRLYNNMPCKVCYPHEVNDVSTKVYNLHGYRHNRAVRFWTPNLNTSQPADRSSWSILPYSANSRKPPLATNSWWS